MLFVRGFPRVKDRFDRWIIQIQAVEDYPGMEYSDKTSFMEVPKSHADDVGVWVHEFVEITVSWMLHTILKRESGSKWDGIGDVPLELNPKIHIDGRVHGVQHIMSALTTISGFDEQIISSDEYAEKLPWRNKSVLKASKPQKTGRSFNGN